MSTLGHQYDNSLSHREREVLLLVFQVGVPVQTRFKLFQELLL